MTLKQKLFCEEYLKMSGNATQAAINAGYSLKSARALACETLTKPYIKEYLRKRIKELLSDTEQLTLDWLRQVKSIAMMDSRKAASWNADSVTIKPSDEIDEETAFAINEISDNVTEKSRNIKIKFNDKNKALELLGKYLAILSDNPPSHDEAQTPTLIDTQKRKERIAELLNKT